MRRLPSWMLTKTSAAAPSPTPVPTPVTGNRDNGDEDDISISSKKKSIKDQKRKRKRRIDTTDNAKQQDLQSVVDSSSLAKTMKKRRKRDAHEEDSRDNKIVKKECRIVGKRGKAKYNRFVDNTDCESEGIETPSPTQDDSEELTVEDVVSIAEEYVKASNDLEQRQSSSRECKSPVRISTTTSSRAADHESRSENGAALVSSEPHVSSSNEQSFTSIVRTGDPAQDMLNLFLGPLLNKPVGDDNKAESIGGDMLYSQHLKAKTHSEVGEDIAPHVKKRSSLKDKVSSLLA